MSRQAKPNTSPGSGDMEKNHVYEGQGTEQDPFVVEFQKDDAENPMNWGQTRKWLVACIATLSVFVVTFTSSAYSESSVEILRDFGTSTEVFVLGVSVYVLGFAIGPVMWAPLVSTPLYQSSDGVNWVRMLTDISASKSPFPNGSQPWSPSLTVLIS
jgi:hypothetical protein